MVDAIFDDSVDNRSVELEITGDPVGNRSVAVETLVNSVNNGSVGRILVDGILGDSVDNISVEVETFVDSVNNISIGEILVDDILGDPVDTKHVELKILGDLMDSRTVDKIVGEPVDNRSVELGKLGDTVDNKSVCGILIDEIFGDYVDNRPVKTYKVVQTEITDYIKIQPVIQPEISVTYNETKNRIVPEPDGTSGHVNNKSVELYKVVQTEITDCMVNNRIVQTKTTGYLNNELYKGAKSEITDHIYTRSRGETNQNDGSMEYPPNHG